MIRAVAVVWSVVKRWMGGGITYVFWPACQMSHLANWPIHLPTRAIGVSTDRPANALSWPTCQLT